MQRTRLIRIAVRTTVAALALTGLVGVLHLPIFGALLRKISPATVCPVVRGTPEQIDRAHSLTAAAIRGAAAAPAPARPALVFQLDGTRRSDVLAWAAAHGTTCASIAGNENLQRCSDVPPAAVGQPEELGALEEVTFEFRSSGELVNVQTMRRRLGAEQAARAVVALERRAAATLGDPSTTGGAPTAGHLARGPLSSYVAVHEFTDYRATVSATNLAETGVMVREEYLSAR